MIILCSKHHACASIVMSDLHTIDLAGPMGELQVSQVAHVDCVSIPAGDDKVGAHCPVRSIFARVKMCGVRRNVI